MCTLQSHTFKDRNIMQLLRCLLFHAALTSDWRQSTFLVYKNKDTIPRNSCEEFHKDQRPTHHQPPTHYHTKHYQLEAMAERYLQSAVCTQHLLILPISQNQLKFCSAINLPSLPAYKDLLILWVADLLLRPLFDCIRSHNWKIETRVGPQRGAQRPG